MNRQKEPLIDDREWEAQEHGMRAARDPETETADPASESYRRVATAVIRAPRSEPPADLASGILAQVAHRDAGVERALFRSLFFVLAAASIIVTALYGGHWWQAMQGVPTTGALPWVLVGAGCMALSWMIGQLHQLAGHVSN